MSLREDVSKNEPGSPSNSGLNIQRERPRRFFSPEVDLVTRPNTDTAKITIAVSKKIAARAVDRNRIKRIIKEALRKTDNLNVSLTIIVKKNIAGLKSYQVAEKLKKILLNND